MRTWLLLILLSASALEGCIPIGVRAGTMPYASLSQATVAVLAEGEGMHLRYRPGSRAAI